MVLACWVVCSKCWCVFQTLSGLHQDPWAFSSCSQPSGARGWQNAEGLWFTPGLPTPLSKGPCIGEVPRPQPKGAPGSESGTASSSSGPRELCSCVTRALNGSSAQCILLLGCVVPSPVSPFYSLTSVCLLLYSVSLLSLFLPCSHSPPSPPPLSLPESAAPLRGHVSLHTHGSQRCTELYF